MMRTPRGVAVAFGVFYLIHPADSRADSLSPVAAQDQLGSVNFPTSCSSQVQPAIERGVALLHSFQYQVSEQAFADAAARDPKCAVAHWGKAMALYHQLWDFPDGKTLKEGHQDIEAARKLHPARAREQGLVNAAAAFFQKKSRMTHAERTQAYSLALEKTHAQSPDDV